MHVLRDLRHGRRGDERPAHSARGLTSPDRVLHNRKADAEVAGRLHHVHPQRRAPGRTEPARLQWRLLADGLGRPEMLEDRVAVVLDVLDIGDVVELRHARQPALRQEDLPAAVQAEELAEALRDHLRHVVVAARRHEAGRRVADEEVTQRHTQDRKHLLLNDAVDVCLGVATVVGAVHHDVLGAEGTQEHTHVAEAGGGEVEVHGEQLEHQHGHEAHDVSSPRAANADTPEKLPDDGAAGSALEPRNVLHNSRPSSAIRRHQVRSGASHVRVVRVQDAREAPEAEVEGEEEADAAASEEAPAGESAHVLH
mmetsp:Transcript_9364/g.24180  ORF Transcript_9364/g.24180 Transcript_9364/m.24180 type:complete len:311 (-) Transcript_9364:1879-2811(-)